MKAVAILNASAGIGANTGSAAVSRELREALAGAGIDATLEIVEPAKIDRAVRDAIAARSETVIVGGGDGTIRSAAELLANTEVVLGVLPFGTLNHFARDLKLPADWHEAVRALATATVGRVDVGEVNGHVFLNNCSVGAYAEAVRRRDSLRQLRSQSKWPAMVRASFETFRRFRRFRLRIVTGGTSRAVRTPLLLVGNNRYIGHVLNSSVRPRLDEGRLWIYCAHAPHQLAFLRLVFQLLVRRIDDADALGVQEATEFALESDSGKLPVAIDGEPIDLKGPLRFRIRPKALRVLMPMKE